MIKKLELYTNDISKIERFYKKVLGFEVITRSKDEISFKIEFKSSILTFKKTDKKISQNHFAFNIPRDKLYEYYNNYHQKLLWLQNEDKDIVDLVCWDEKALYFLDCDNNLLEFITRKNVKDIMIGEVAIVLRQVKQKIESISRTLNIDLYKKECTNTNFYSLGDIEGLLLFIEKGKKLFPTDIVAKTTDLKIVYEVDEKQYILEVKNEKFIVMNKGTIIEVFEI